MSSKDKNKFRAILDRIEGDQAVLELPDCGQVIIPVIFLPKNIHDGSVLDFEVKNNIEEETKRRDEILELQNKLLKKK